MADDQRPAAPASLYDEDFYAWTQAQAAAMAGAGRAGRMAPGVDWERLSEEVGDLGKSELNGALSLAARIIEHLFLLSTSGNAEPRNHWRKEIRAFRRDLARQLTPTIRKLVGEELESLHARAAKDIAAELADAEPAALPLDTSLRWSLPQILGEENDPLA